MFIYYTMSPSPPSCRPPFRLIVKGKWAGDQKVSSIWLKLAMRVAYGYRPSSLHEIFASVKTLMSLERFEVGSFSGIFSK